MLSTQATSIRRLLATFCAFAVSALSTLTAQVVSFDANEPVQLESGWIAMARPSGFTAAEQAWILRLVNAKLQAAGINLNATSGSTGPCRIVISNSQEPPVPGATGSESDIGAGDGEPSIVYLMEMPDVPIYEHVHDVANAIKALIAAKHGAGANQHASADAMTQQQGTARFTDLAYDGTAATQMLLNAGVTNALTDPVARPTDVRYRVNRTPGRRLQTFDCTLTYAAGLQAGSRFGHLRADGTFVTHGQQGVLETAPASYFFDGRGVDFAIRLSNGTVHSLSNGHGRVDLLNANPQNFDVFAQIRVQFDVNADMIPDATLDVQASQPGIGGFYTDHFRGTGEDLALDVGLNTRVSWLMGKPAQVVSPGATIRMGLQSLEGLFYGNPGFIVGTVFATTPPAAIPGFPGLYLEPGHFILSIGSMSPAGLSRTLTIPASGSGLHLLLQGCAFGQWSNNGLVGASDGVTVTVL